MRLRRGRGEVTLDSGEVRGEVTLDSVEAEARSRLDAVDRVTEPPGTDC